MLKTYLCLLLFSFSFSLTSQDSQPNVIFILADDLNADFLGCAGHPILKTPHIDQLAQKGARFTNALVTTSICAASRASIFTGLHERTHKYTFGTPPIAESMTDNSYPKIFKDAGYQTGFVGKFGVGVHKGVTDKMFDEMETIGRNPYFKPQKDGSLRHETELCGDWAESFVEKHRNKPFCLSISFNAAHAEDNDKVNHFPWPKSVDHLYKNINIPYPELHKDEIYEQQPDFLKESLNRERYFWRWDSKEKYQHNMKAYLRMISGIDHVVGRVHDKLKKLGIDNNTIIIFTGDNGYYAARREFAGKWSHYEESLRVPLVIYDPRKPQKHLVVHQIALNIDLPATMLDLAGLSVPKSYQGKSLSPLLKGKSQKWREDSFHEHLMNYSKIPKWEGVRNERYVYANYFQQDPPYEFLHDLKKDPHQLKNFVDHPEYKEILVKLRKRSTQLRNQVGGEYSLENYPSKIRR